MEIQSAIRILSRNKAVFESLFQSISPMAINWRPAEDKWSFLEIVCHLLDEERMDFRARISSLFNDPNLPFEPIDPEKWVESHRYVEQNYDDICERFIAEREYSVAWLNDQLNEDWEVSYNSPHFGPMSARFMLNNWVAHDLLHINQWNKTHFRFIQHFGLDLKYAGAGL